MPVRSLSSPVFKWPDRDAVHRAFADWVKQRAKEKPELLRAGYFGSYARGNWGVTSDLDILLILDQSPLDFHQRAASWDATSFPVPADVLIYTVEEWKAMERRGDRFYRMIKEEVVWVFDKREIVEGTN
jgi:uncharacterized protein